MFARRWVRFGLVLVGLVLVVALAALSFPSAWLQADATGDPTGVRTAIVFGFGFERYADGTMAPGAANEFLLDWTLTNHPDLDTALVQEGAWVAACPQAARRCAHRGVRLLRIDNHRDDLDLHTLDIAACALERLQAAGRDRAVVVAHDLQLARAAGALERVANAGLCPDCELVIAGVPDTPYPERTEQLRTRSERVYRQSELAARIRFSPLLSPTVPQTCRAPVREHPD